jgi:cell fate regulator YaaT (PSP1 superfamily)
LIPCSCHLRRQLKIKNLAIKLRKFGQICPIAGYKEEAIKLGAKVIVETDRGQEAGQIVAFEKGFPKHLSREVRLRKVVRYANASDLHHIEGLDEKERAAMKIGMQKVREHELPIKIISIEYLFDDRKAHFYYRITGHKKALNTRELIRDLSASLSAKIDMHLVSPRDEAKIIGGLGPCGRSLCCVAWLDKPRHVSVKALKEKGISISQTKTSGCCGRLMCCLQYEMENEKDK